MKRKSVLSVCVIPLAFILASVSVIMFLQSCTPETPYTGNTVPEYVRKWTTVVYMAADNDLEGAALADLREMLSAAAPLKQAGFTFLALLDRSAGYDTAAGNWSDTRLFEIGPGDFAADDFSDIRLECKNLGLADDRETELNMAAPETLNAILSYAMKQFPAEHYALILWGHGSGWRGYSIDEESNAVMSLPQLHAALTHLESPLSVIAFDCCYGAMLETAYELRDDADFLIATERDEPAAGWNYSFFLENLATSADSCTGETGAETYARLAVEAFGKQYADEQNASITAIALKEMADAVTAFEKFSAACAACLTTRSAALFFTTEILGGTKTFLTGEYPAYSFVDAGSLAECFLAKGIPSVSPSLLETAYSAAEALLKTLSKATVAGFAGGAVSECSMNPQSMIAVYLATIRAGGVVEADYPQLYVRGSGVGGQCMFVRDSMGWVPQHAVIESTSLLDHLYRMPLP